MYGKFYTKKYTKKTALNFRASRLSFPLMFLQAKAPKLAVSVLCNCFKSVQLLLLCLVAVF